MDGIFLHFVKEELAAKLQGARVIKVIQTLKEEVVVTLKAKNQEYNLLISASSLYPRVYLMKEKPVPLMDPPMFCMLLRKHLMGGIVTKISQEGLDRIIYIEFNALNQISERTSVCLVAELMGKYSNIVLVGNTGKVVGAAKIIHGQRSVLVGRNYERQTQPGKINLITERWQSDGRELGKSIQGLGNRTYTLLKKSLKDDAAIVTFICDTLNENKNVKPVMLTEETFPVFFDFDEFKNKLHFDSFCELLETFFKDKARTDLIKQRTSDLRGIVNIFLKRVRNRIKSQSEELEECKEKEEKRLKGDLLLANLNNLKDLGNCSGEIKLRNFYDEKQSRVAITLDPKLTVSQNAQKYYKEYHKLQVAEKKLTELICEGEKELEYLQSVVFGLDQVVHESRLEEIRQELMEQGYIKTHTKKKKEVKNKFLPEVISLATGGELLVGKNNLQNEYVTFKAAKKNDLWFHAQKVPGSHVILRVKNGEEAQDSEIEEAAKVAASNSRAQGGSLVAVDFTTAKNVRKMPGGKPGMVTYVNFKTVFVNPSPL
ncbi:fibronectin-binding protein A [Clostridia bacterium]|nr:fibronectin-binding protein A [Clostridia bacterium]